MPRRIPTFFADFKWSNMATTVGYVFTFASACILFVDLFLSYRRPKITVDDPWEVNDVQQSLEWATSCPPPVYNFVQTPPIPIVDQLPPKH